MLNKEIYLFIIVLLFTLTSCEKLFFEENMAATDPFENFEYLWKECDEKYSFFEVKDIDWNVIKEEYSAQLYEGMTEDSLFQVLGSMLSELRDDHTNLSSDFNVSRYGVSYTAQDNFDFRVVIDNYIGTDFYVTENFAHDFVDNGEIGYIRFSSFSGVSANSLDYILERYEDTKGLILDLRSNGGGNINDVFSILSRFVEEETLVNYSRIKNGPGHSDFSEALPVMVSPYDGIRYTNKVVFLTDRGSYSASSFTSLATKALDNITLIGDSTGGGLGLPNGGQLPNGWDYRFSITQALTLDLSPDFENGVPPDIFVNLDLTDLTKDEILDRAIEELQ